MGKLMQLSERQRRHLKGLAHPLKPVILMGNAGLTDAVVAATTEALEHHELIKVRLAGGQKSDREQVAEDVAEALSCAVVQIIGHMLVLFRPAPEEA